MKFPIILIFACGLNLLFNNKTWAGLDDLPIGARSLAMGATYVALANTADAVFLNPGGLSQLSGTEISLFYQKPFGLEDVSFGTASVSFPIWKYRASVGVLTLGNSLYTEQVFSLAVSHHYQNKIYYGLAIRCQTVKIDRYGTGGSAGIDLGSVVPITSKLTWGFLAKNLNRPSIGESNEKLPQSLKTGISIFPTSKLVLNIEIFKDVRFTEEFRFGAEFKPVDNLALRAGNANNPNRFSAGFGLKVDRFAVDYAFFTHNDLGLTHQVSFSAHFGEMDGEQQPADIPHIVIREEQQDTEGQIQITDSTKAALNLDLKVNINTANVEELTALPGIAKKTALAIIEYRNKHGWFTKREDLMNVSGIGPKKFEKLKEKIIIKDLAAK